MSKYTILILFIFFTANTSLSQTADDYYNLAKHAQKEYRYDDAIKYFQLAGDLFIKVGRKDYYATMLNEIGVMYKTLGQYDKAIEYFTKVLAIDEELGMKEGIATTLNNIGLVYQTWGQYDRAIKHYTKALAIAKELGQQGSVATLLNNIGMINKAWGKYDKAVEHFSKALVIFKEHGQQGSVATLLNNIGTVYYLWGQHDKANEYYTKALVINKELGKKDGIAVSLNNIGSVYKDRGQYKKAIENYTEALSVHKEIRQQEGIATDLNNIGSVYQVWGQYDKAFEYLTKAQAINEKLGRMDQLAIQLNNIGFIYQTWGQYDKAIEHYTRALAINEKLGKKDGIAFLLNNIGFIYQTLGQYSKAIEYYNKALTIAEELGQKEGIATSLNNIGLVYQAWEQYDNALEHFIKAHAIAEELGKKEGIATDMNNIGVVYADLKEYTKAGEYLRKSIAIKEELRLTATGSIRRDYLASQLYTYQFLVSTYIRDNKPDLAFNTVELSSTKYLLEQMGERLNEKDIRFGGVENYRKKLNNNTAIINYANINTWMGTEQIVVDRNNIFAVEVEPDNLISNINSRYTDVISNAFENLRGMKRITKSEDEKMIKKEENADFDKIINYYRLLLSKPRLTSKERETVKYIGKELYKFLFGSIEAHLNGKDELIIIPDGVLSFLPFETLIMPDGRYLIEKYHIKYTQSLAVSEIIARRNYSQDRKPMLAFGGAVYDEMSYQADIVKSEKQLEYLTNETLLALNRGQSARGAYSSLGFEEWKNLPGTLTEVNAIKELINGSDIYTGKSVDESKVKSLSREGVMKRYKVLHFATHGLVVPEIPELSAIVLSLSKQEGSEDGYLTMKEIAGLDINADFVNLSACETGLGKIYGGEGVVGLTQSFLVAGANGLSVSLWQVSDESTMKFMIGVYKLVQEKGIGYDKAITEMKRAFLEIESYSSPFYWAPFVYYGE
ncbi:MAG: CHAT domain-containing tetratricopeptide repeat protein [Candidatus Hatepunaea meridiana]|nr:CHAT domain-containing tetratricopeptide repeat protein [Candidatus Hatepunaea meridiana]